jgi:hypothetical protein
MCLGVFELKMHEKNKQDPRCKGVNQLECIEQPHMDPRAHQSRKTNLGQHQLTCHGPEGPPTSLLPKAEAGWSSVRNMAPLGHDCDFGDCVTT